MYVTLPLFSLSLSLYLSISLSLCLYGSLSRCPSHLTYIMLYSPFRHFFYYPLPNCISVQCSGDFQAKTPAGRYVRFGVR